MSNKYDAILGEYREDDAGAGGVTSVNGDSGPAVTLTQDDVADGTTYKQYSQTEKTKLAGIEAGAEVNNISTANATDLTDGGTTTLHTHDVALDDLTDVDTTGVADGDVLTYDSGTSEWLPVAPSGGPGGSAPADQATYTFSTTTTASDPGATYFRLNYNTIETVNNKVLTGNVATLTTVATHNYAVGDYVYVSIGDATFDGWQTITDVNAGAKTFSFAKTAASIASTATSGTAFNVTKITELYIDTTGNSSTDYTEFFKQLNAGDTLVLANTTDATKWLRVRIKRTPTNNTGWYTLQITWTGGTLVPANNDVISLLAEHNQPGQVLTWQTPSGSIWAVPPTTFGADGDWCLVLPGTSNIHKNYGGRFIQKTNGAWQPSNSTTPSTLLDPQYVIPSMGQSVAPSPITGQGVSTPVAGGTNLIPKDWYTNSGSIIPEVKFGSYHIAPNPGDKVSIGKGLGSFGNENLAFFGATLNVQGIPMDLDNVKMKFSTNTAASDPGTEFIKVNNATASSVTQVYCSELGYTRTITNKALTSGVATLTTSAAHGYFVKQRVTVTGVDTTFNGTYVITAVGATTFSYAKQHTVTNKALTSNVATLTIGTHAMQVGNSITIAGVDATFNGTYTLTAVGATTISYAKTASNVVSTSATGTASWADVASVASGGSVNADLTQQFTYSPTATSGVTEYAPYGIRIVQDSDATRFIHLYNCTTTTDNGTWRTTPGTFAQVGAGGLPANNADVTVRFYYNNAMWVANGYAESQYGVGVCVRGDGNVSLRGVADRGIFASKGGTHYISNTVLTANVATITTSQAHGFAIGDNVTITNATNSVYNGNYTITAPLTATTFSYARTNANIGSAASIGEASTGAQISDYLYITKYVSTFQAYLVRNNAQVYAIPASGQPPFLLAALFAYDDLLGTQGLMFTTTSRDAYGIPKFTF